MSRVLKSQKLLEVAGKSIDNGDRVVAKEMAVLALKQDDAIDALDRLLPSPPEPPQAFDTEEEDNLSQAQVSKILALAKELGEMKKHKVVNKILAKVEQIEAKKKRRKRQA